MNGYYISVDSGGTKTDALLFDGSGNVLNYAFSEGGNSVYLPEETALKNVGGAISRLLDTAGIAPCGVDEIALFIPGFSQLADKFKQITGLNQCVFYGDEPAAYFGALGSGRGICVLAGTGSFAAAFIDGKRVSVGGWGTLFHDRGSAYHAGIMLLEHVTREIDEGCPLGELSEEVLKILSCDKDEYRKRIYCKDIDRRFIAGLAKTAHNFAEKGDTHAIDILKETAYSLANLADCLHRRVYGGKNLPVALTGGLTNAGNFIIAPFVERLKTLNPLLAYQKPLYPEVVGGMLYTLYKNGADIESKKIKDNILSYKKFIKR